MSIYYWQVVFHYIQLFLDKILGKTIFSGRLAFTIDLH